MTILLITRFGGFPTLQVGSFYAVWLSKWRFGLCRARAVETKNGVCTVAALNVGRLMVMRETKIADASTSTKSEQTGGLTALPFLAPSSIHPQKHRPGCPCV
jgi:hypothetical protein